MFGRLHAKFRRLGYHVPQCEKLLRQLIFDELSTYTNLYEMPDQDVNFESDKE